MFDASAEHLRGVITGTVRELLPRGPAPVQLIVEGVLNMYHGRWNELQVRSVFHKMLSEGYFEVDPIWRVTACRG